MIRRTFRRPPARRGAILLVVLGMLALFAVVGLSFVLYAESEATGARNNRAARNELADPDPAVVANGFLAQLIFDTGDPASAVHGHSFARSRFGPVGGQSPYIGTGIPGEALTPNGLNSSGAALPLTIDRLQAVNFRFFPNPGLPGFGWDPVSPDTSAAGPTQSSSAPTVPTRRAAQRTQTRSGRSNRSTRRVSRVTLTRPPLRPGPGPASPARPA